MKKNILVTIMVILLFTLRILAQTKPDNLSALKIGDKIPPFLFQDVLNYTDGKMNLHDLKGKLIILDFWNVACKACLESWPKLIDLQYKFKNDIQIVAVNPTDDVSKIKTTISRQERIYHYQMNIPIAYNCSPIKVLFPHQAVPLIVILDKNLRVLYITNGQMLNKETIQNILLHKAIAIQEKSEEYLDVFKPFFIHGNVGVQNTGQNVGQSTIITPYSEEILSLRFIQSYNQKTKLYYRGDSIPIIPPKFPSASFARGCLANSSAEMMFRVLYGGGGDLALAVPHSRIDFDIDSNRLVTRINGAIRQENLFTIQFISQQYSPIAKIKYKMIKDLELYLNLKTHWELKRKKCIVISRNSNPITTYTKGDESMILTDTSFHINKISVDRFINELAYRSFLYQSDYPIVNETGFKGLLGEIFFQSNDHALNYDLLSSELAKNGLSLSIEEREIDILVFTADKSDL